MKTLLFFLIIFSLDFRTQTKPYLSLTDFLKAEDDERAAFQADDPGLRTTVHEGKISCLSPWGYCLMRQYRCTPGFVIKERFNNCPNNRTLKCCVLS